MSRKTTTAAANTNTAADFSKVQILASRRWAGNRDLLDVLLDDDQRYTEKQLIGILDSYLHKEI